MTVFNTTYPNAKKKPETVQRIPAIDEIVDREFATLFIVERSGNGYETQRIQRDKVGKKIDTALQNGKLWSDNGSYSFGDLIAWICTKKEFGKAAHGFLPMGHASANLTLPSMNLTASAYSLPPGAEECQLALRIAYQELNATREENVRLRAEVNALMPNRAKVQKRSTDGKIYGAQGGRGNKK
jgi:hypothetical protein